MRKQGAAGAGLEVSPIDRLIRGELVGWFPVMQDFVARHVEDITNFLWSHFRYEYYDYEYWTVSFFLGDTKYQFFSDGSVELCTRMESPLGFAQEILEFNGVSVGLDEMQVVEYTKNAYGCRCAVVDAGRNRYTVWEDGTYYRRPRAKRDGDI